MFRHFKTLKEARAYIEKKDPDGYLRLIYRKNKKAKKPYVVGASLSFLHFA